MEKLYKWATNPIKLQRAIASAVHKDEKSVRKEYIKIGGLIANGYAESAEEVKEPVEDKSVTAIHGSEENIIEVKAIKEVIKKRGRPSSK